MKKIVLPCMLVALISASAHAANLASDHAGDAAYSPLTWTNGSNGGYGFGPWNLAATPNAGHFMWTSVNNADQLDDGNVGGVANDNDIDTQDPLGQYVSWGMYAPAPSSATAIRPFTGTTPELEPGQTFSVDFDTGFIAAGGRASVALLDGANNPILTVFFIGGAAAYEYSDATGTFSTGIGWGSEGLTLSVTIGNTGFDYTATLTRRDGVSTNWTGVMNTVARGFGAQLSRNGPGGAQFDFFINSMSIVPEPSTIALAALGVIGVAVRAFRRRA